MLQIPALASLVNDSKSLARHNSSALVRDINGAIGSKSKTPPLLEDRIARPQNSEEDTPVSGWTSPIFVCPDTVALEHLVLPASRRPLLLWLRGIYLNNRLTGPGTLPS